MVSGVWGSAADSCLLLLYTSKNFYKATVLVIKPFIDIEKEQTAPLFLFKLCTFYWWESKNIICPERRALNAGSGSFGSRPSIFKDTVERLGQWRIKRGRGSKCNLHFQVLG